MVCLESYDEQPPADAVFPAEAVGALMATPLPNTRTSTSREYGNRVGVFHVMDTLARHRISATAAVDAGVARRIPWLVRHCLEQGWEIAAHGQSVNQVISATMTEEQERAYLTDSLQAVAEAAGVVPRGWHGPEYGESTRTPQLLAELGLAYLADWPNDDLPYWMHTTDRPLISLPVALELDDAFVMWNRRLLPWDWQQLALEHINELHAQAADGPRVLVLNLHPWLIGQPFRIGALDAVLAHIRSLPEVWFATARDIAASFAEQVPA